METFTEFFWFSILAFNDYRILTTYILILRPYIIQIIVSWHQFGVNLLFSFINVIISLTYKWFINNNFGSMVSKHRIKLMGVLYEEYCYMTTNTHPFYTFSSSNLILSSIYLPKALTPSVNYSIAPVVFKDNSAKSINSLPSRVFYS